MKSYFKMVPVPNNVLTVAEEGDASFFQHTRYPVSGRDNPRVLPDFDLAKV
jgi:hypothetical protein